MMLAYFLLASLDLLGTLESSTSEEERAGWIDWVWAQQVPSGGFRGAPFAGEFDPTSPSSSINTYQAHLASTYTALLILALLRAPLDRLDREGLQKHVASCQTSDGSFSPLTREVNAETDIRMVLCAAVICDLVGDWSGMDVERAEAFIHRCRSHEGGYGGRPHQEAAGGPTYCAVAALKLLSSAPTRSPPPFPPSTSKRTTHWLVHRQIQHLSLPSGADDGPPRERGGGFQGRTGKKGDACYSFWLGGALSILGADRLISSSANRSFLLRCQSIVGGFAKYPNDRPDPFHTYASLASLALFADSAIDNDFTLNAMDPLRNVGVRAVDWFVSERARLQWMAPSVSTSTSADSGGI